MSKRSMTSLLRTLVWLRGDGRTSGRWQILIVAVIAQIGFSMADQGIPLLLGFVKTDLDISSTLAGLAVSSFLFGKIFGSYLAGATSDRIGEREVLLGGGLISAALIGVAAATPGAWLFAVLLLAGFASAAGTPGGGRLVVLAFPPDQRGLALGIRQTGIPIAGLAAAIILPPVADTAGWRWSLVVIAMVMALAVIPLSWTPVPRPDPAARPRHSPGVSRLWRLRLLTIWGCLLVTGQFAVVAFLPLDLHAGAGLSLPTAAMLVAVAQAAGILGRVFWGAFSDRFLAHGREPLLIAVTAIGLLSALLLFAIPRSAPLPVLVAIAALAGLALIGYQGLWVTMVAETTGPESAGAAMGFAVTFVFAAAALTPPLYGLVADAAGSYRAIWAALSAVLAVAFVPALLLRR